MDVFENNLTIYKLILFIINKIHFLRNKDLSQLFMYNLIASCLRY